MVGHAVTGAMRSIVVTLSRKAEMVPETRHSSSISRFLFPPLQASGPKGSKKGARRLNKAESAEAVPESGDHNIRAALWIRGSYYDGE